MHSQGGDGVLELFLGLVVPLAEFHVQDCTNDLYVASLCITGQHPLLQPYSTS